MINGIIYFVLMIVIGYSISEIYPRVYKPLFMFTHRNDDILKDKTVDFSFDPKYLRLHSILTLAITIIGVYFFKENFYKDTFFSHVVVLLFLLNIKIFKNRFLRIKMLIQGRKRDGE